MFETGVTLPFERGVVPNRNKLECLRLVVTSKFHYRLIFAGKAMSLTFDWSLMIYYNKLECLSLVVTFNIV